jgi:hypothetical protein
MREAIFRDRLGAANCAIRSPQRGHSRGKENMTWPPNLTALEERLGHLLAEAEQIKIDQAVIRDHAVAIKNELHNLTDRLGRIENLLGLTEKS